MSENYSYDLVGNRLSSLNVGSYSYNGSNELTSSSDGYSYTYDNNGNTLTKTLGTDTTASTWDFENRLAQVTLPESGGTLTFKYDPFGRRIQKVSPAGTTNYIYDGANTLDEVDGSGGVLARYTQALGIDEPLAQSRAAAIDFYQADALDSITSLSSVSTQLVNTYTYAAFGDLTSLSGTDRNPFQYTGREYDNEIGILYYRARYYDQHAGRFLNEDSMRFSAGDLNFYRYAFNQPVLYNDPSGHCFGPISAIVCIAVGLGVADEIISAINQSTGLQNLVNLAQNYRAAFNAAIVACSGSGDCDAAVDTAAETYENLLKAAGATTLDAATLPGTLTGGLPPSSKLDLALNPISDRVLEKVKEKAGKHKPACTSK